MVSLMKTTFNIDDALMQQLRLEAAKRGVTMTHIVESGIRHMIRMKNASDAPEGKSLDLPSKSMGKPRVDISNRDELYRIFDAEKPPW